MASLAPHVGIRSQSDLHLVLVGPRLFLWLDFFFFFWLAMVLWLELMLTEGNECNLQGEKANKN